MSKQWFYQVMGSEVGPISSADLKHKVHQGQIQPDTMVRVAPDGKWQTADRVKGLLDPPAALPKTAAASVARKEPEKNAAPAAVATAVSKPKPAPDVDGRTYHFAGEEHADGAGPQAAPEPSGEFDFFRFVGFEQAIGHALFQVLDDHCRANKASLTDVTRRALAEHLGRKDLLGEAPPATTPEAAPEGASPE